MISGANRGIGRAIAERLHEEGYLLSLGARRVESLSALTESMETSRRLAHPYEARDPRAPVDWVEATIERFGRIDGLVNNAGVLYRFSVEDDNEALLDEMWEVNTKGPLRLIRAAFPHLKASGAGRVVNIVSLSGKRVVAPWVAGYCMSKFATSALTHALRYSGWEHGIRATAICPNIVATDMIAEFADLPPEKMIHPGVVAQLVATVLALPNPTSIAEIPVNCRLEHSV
jgi:NAD(P)-dependent dehydrogenase (short-subunit alcohol dehydrogenase family)